MASEPDPGRRLVALLSQERRHTKSGANVTAGDAELAVDEATTDLAEGLVELSMLSAAQLTLEQLLVQVAGLVMQVVPGADGAGLTLREHKRVDVTVHAHGFASDIEHIQNAIGEGPCVSAAAGGVTVCSGSLSDDRRWPRFARRARRLGVQSVLSLPLLAPTGVVGVVSVYARAYHAFDERAARLGTAFVGPAAVTVHNAQVLAQTKRLVNQLQAAVTTRPVIDQAIGILRSRTGISEEEALQRLRQLSQSQHARVAVIAERMVADAARRASARRT